MTVRVDGRIFKRTGHCCRCGLCCRVDFVNYADYRDWDTVHQNLFGSMCPPACSFMVRDSEGKIICKGYKGRDFGCRAFPWHPLQLTNTECEDLPRIPIYKSGRYLTSTPVEEVDEKGSKIVRHVIDQKDVTKDDGIIVGYNPFSTVCTFRFEDITDDFKVRFPNMKVRRALGPVVAMRKPAWMGKR